MKRAIFLGIIPIALLLGCDRSTPSAPPVPRKSPADVRGTCVVHGHIFLRGTPPAMETIPNRPCHDGAEPLKEETVVVDPTTSGLKNVFVSIEGLPPVDGATLPPAMLDQINCQYVPHAIGVCVGQTMTVRSSDPAMHNTTYSPQFNAAKNLVTTSPGDTKSTTFTAAEYIHARCDVHPWMSATIGVFDTPFFAVSAADGSFEISKLPAGHYKLIAWHERYGQTEQTLDVSDAKPVTIDFEYRAQ